MNEVISSASGALAVLMADVADEFVERRRRGEQPAGEPSRPHDVVVVGAGGHPPRDHQLLRVRSSSALGRRWRAPSAVSNVGHNGA